MLSLQYNALVLSTHFTQHNASTIKHGLYNLYTDDNT